jgi:lysophospholipase L1-like esterase
MPNLIVGSGKLLVIILVFFGTLEFSARTDDAIRYGAPFWKEYSADILHVDDKEGFRRNVPNARFEKWQNNRYGFRGADFSLDKSPDVLRVVCLGSSETYGYHESPEKEWPAQLKEQLPKNKFQVINAAVVGTSLPSFSPYLEKIVLPLKPDVVILVVPPLFYFNYNKQVVPLNVQKSTDPNLKPSVPLVSKILSNIRCLPKVKRVVKKAIKNDFPTQFSENQLQTLTRQVHDIELLKLSGNKPLDSIPDEYLKRFHDELTALVVMLKGQNVKVVLTSYPSLLNVQTIKDNPEIVLGIRKFCIGLSPIGLIDGYEKFNAISALVAAEQNMLFVDCAKALPRTTEYFVDGVHYTDLGARRMSELIASTLLSSKELSAIQVARDGVKVGNQP